jgi:hypothetical protein
MCLTVEDAVKMSLPEAYGQRNNKLFELVRHLRRIVPNATTEELKIILRQWHTLALPHIRTKTFGISHAEFQSLWKRVVRPSGRPLWHEIISIASTVPVPVWATRYPDRFQHLIKLCIAANQTYGGGDWPLSCRFLGTQLFVGHDTAARMLQQLVIDGVLEVSKVHSKIRRLATEYRWIGGPR